VSRTVGAPIRWLTLVVGAGLLAACATPGTTASLAPALPSVSAAPSEAAEPVEDPADRLQARLLEIMDAPDLAYRFEQTADITSDSASFQQTASGEVSGRDVHMTVTTVQGTDRTVSEIAVLNGTAFQRDGSGAWSRSGQTTAVVSVVPQLAQIFDLTTMRYAGHEVHEGAYLQHLAMRDPVTLTGDLTTAWLPSSATTGTLDSLDLYLDSDGRPADISYELTFDVQADASSDPVELHGVYQATYADVGQDVPIQVDGLTPSVPTT
jgi:hypothetical protein